MFVNHLLYRLTTITTSIYLNIGWFNLILYKLNEISESFIISSYVPGSYLRFLKRFSGKVNEISIYLITRDEK